VAGRALLLFILRVAQDTVIKRLNKAVLFLGALLALSVCANFGVSFVAVELSRNTDVDEDTNAGTRKGELLVKDGDGHAVVKVSETVVDIKMLLTPALPYDMLERIKTVEYISDRTMHDVEVAGYSYVSESSFTLHLETGGKLQMDGMAVFETKPDGSGPFELPASALAGQLVNESRCFDNEALFQTTAFLPGECGSRNGFAPNAAAILDRAANKTTCLTRIADGYANFATDCCTSPRVTTSGAEGDAPWPQAGRGCLCMAAWPHVALYSPLVLHCRHGLRDGMHRPLHPAARRHIYDPPRRVPRHVGCAAPPKLGHMPRGRAAADPAQGCPGSASLGRSGGLARPNGLRGLHGRCDDESTLNILAARSTEPVPWLPPGFSTGFWTWGGSNNNLVHRQGPTKGVTPGRGICVRALARRGSGNALLHPPSAGHAPPMHHQRPAARPC